MMRHFLLPVAAAILSFAACTQSTTPGPAFVQFRVTSDRGPCSVEIAVRLLVDDVPVGDEVFRINYPPDRTESSLFAVPPGTHVLRGQLFRWGDSPRQDDPRWWPDTTVTLTSNQLLVHTLDAYCS